MSTTKIPDVFTVRADDIWLYTRDCLSEKEITRGVGNRIEVAQWAMESSSGVGFVAVKTAYPGVGQFVVAVADAHGRPSSAQVRKTVYEAVRKWYPWPNIRFEVQGLNVTGL